MRAMDPAVLKQITEELIPFNRFLGIVVDTHEHGRIRLRLPFREELIGDPMKRALHGGVLSTIADAAGGIAVWTTLEAPWALVSTIDLRVDYLRPGRPETIIAEGIVVRTGNRVGVADVRIFHPSHESETIATGKGVYAIKSKRPKDDAASA